MVAVGHRIWRGRPLAWTVILALASFAVLPSTAQASFIINTDGTSTAGGGADTQTAQNATVNAQVIISFAANGTMTVTLNNLLSTSSQISQSITGITFATQPTITVNSPLKSTSGQLETSSGTFVETGATGLDSQGQFIGGSSSSGSGTSYFDNMSGTGHNAVGASNWAVTAASPGTISVFSGGTPTQAVVSAGGVAANLNSQHQPVFSQSVTLVANTTANLSTTVTGVTFLFGTGTDHLTVTGNFNNNNDGNGNAGSVPAPSSMVIALTGLAGVGFVGWRRLRIKLQRS